MKCLRAGVGKEGVLLIMDIDDETNEIGDVFPTKMITKEDIESLVESLTAMLLKHDFDEKHQVRH